MLYNKSMPSLRQSIVLNGQLLLKNAPRQNLFLKYPNNRQFSFYIEYIWTIDQWCYSWSFKAWNKIPEFEIAKNGFS